MTFDEWLKTGRSNKWISEPVCSTHDGIPMTETENAEWEEGGDPCAHVLRLYESPEDCDSAEKADKKND